MVAHGKNAYEIRLDILELARSILSERAEFSRTVREDGEYSQPEFTFNTEDVLAEANKLYAFVEGGK